MRNLKVDREKNELISNIRNRIGVKSSKMWEWQSDMQVRINTKCNETIE